MKQTHQTLLENIKKNKKYKEITNSLIEKKIVAYFKQSPEEEKYLLKEKSWRYRKIVSLLRGELHAIYGSFQGGKEQREELLKTLPNKQAHRKLLESNISTKERIPFYGGVV